MVYFIFPAVVAAFLLIPSVALPVPRAAGQLDLTSGSRLYSRDTGLFVPPPLPLPDDIASPLVPRSATTPRSLPAYTLVPGQPPNDPEDFVFLHPDISPGDQALMYLKNQEHTYPEATHPYPNPIARTNRFLIVQALPAESKYLSTGMFATETTFNEKGHERISNALADASSRAMRKIGREVPLNAYADNFAHDNSDGPTLHGDHHVKFLQDILRHQGADPKVIAAVGEIRFPLGDLAAIATYLRGGEKKWPSINVVINQAYHRHS